MTAAPETKAFSPDATLAVDGLMRAFEHYKATNDERLAAMERRSGDVLLDDKLARIDAALDDYKSRLDTIALKSARPHLGERAVDTAEQREHKSAFEAYVRSGETAGLRRLEAKALSSGSDPDGGYLVTAQIEAEIANRLQAVSPIRAIADVRVSSSGTYRKPFMTSGPAVGWVGETASRPQTGTPTLDSLSFPAAELYAMPAATPQLLEDTTTNIEQWIAAEVEAAFAEQEGAAFINGDGTNKPRGFLQSTTIADASWEWGKLGYIATGAAGALPSSNPSDVLTDLVYALKAGYRQNGTFVMGRKTQATIRKLKDSTGNYLWQPPAQLGARASLMNFPLVEAEDMPDIAANSLSIAFGDFKRGYLIVDRAGMRVLRDPYSAKPYVLFYTTKRVAGGVQNYEAIKLLKFAAS